MGGDVTSVPPDFNVNMTAIWNELWQSMPQTSKPGVVVKQLMIQYKKCCDDERKKHEQDGDRCPLDLFPVSFAYAKDWLLKKQRAQSEALMAGAVNETAREVITELSQSLDEPSTSAASLLEQPARPASPVIPLPQLSLGPEPVTDEARAEERRNRAQERREQQGNPPSKSAGRSVTPHAETPRAKKPKTVDPEMQERQERAKSRMLQLGVTPVEVSFINRFNTTRKHEIKIAGCNPLKCICLSFIITFFSFQSLAGKRPCAVCNQPRTANDKTPDGQIHRFLGKTNKTWCPYADDISILQAFEQDQLERKRATWRRANDAKKLKKQQKS